MTLEDLPEESSYQEVFADEDKDEDGDEDSDTNDEENRHGARSSKRKKSTARSLKHSGISIKQEIVYDFDIKDYSVEKPLRETRVRLPFMSSDVIFNPVTTLIGIVPLWAATIWCMINPDEALENLLEIRGQIANKFTWFIIMTKPLSVFFVMFIAWKYGHIRFGGKDAKPEFGNFEYFTMLFTSGVGVGTFYYGASEPLWHQSSHWFAEAGYRTQDEIDQMAMLITIYHWGVHAWGTYIVVALAISLASYRFRLPMIFRSTFYPILGEYTWGWMGDFLDGTSIVVTIAGLCTSLGLGSMQMAAGLSRIGWVEEGASESDTKKTQIIVIWVITFITACSVMMGLHIGIKYLSLAAFSLGMILLLAVFMMDKSSYIINLTVQSFGQYLHYVVFQLPFHTDAFGQLKTGEGRAIDENAAAAWWFDAWTIFYWNWWVAWSVFVGSFIARISYGRTIREVTVYTLFFPLVVLVAWFSTWGGAALRQARQSLELEKLGEVYYNDTSHFVSVENEYCYDVPQEDVVIGNDIVYENHITGVTPVCKFYSTNDAAFNVLYSFSFPDEWDDGYGPCLSVLFMLAIILWFATSADSGSLVVDILAANGRHDTHPMQRLFWAFTEGLLATALLSAGGSNALSAVQATSIVCGLPYTLLLLYLLQSIYEMCEQALDEEQILFMTPKRQFIMPVYGGIFNIFEYIASLGQVHQSRVILGIDLPSAFQTTECLMSLFLPFVPLQDIVFTMYPKPGSQKTNILLLLFFTGLFLFWVSCLLVAITIDPSLIYWGIAAYTVCSCLLGNLKYTVRQRRRLHGNLIGDLLSSFLLYPQVITQIRIELIEYGAQQVVESKKAKRNRKRTSKRKTKSRVSSSNCLDDAEGEQTVTSTRSQQSKSRRKGRVQSSNDSVSTSGNTRNSANDHNERKEGTPSIDKCIEEQKERAPVVLNSSNHDKSSARRLDVNNAEEESKQTAKREQLLKHHSATDIRSGLRARMEEKTRHRRHPISVDV